MDDETEALEVNGPKQSTQRLSRFLVYLSLLSRSITFIVYSNQLGQRYEQINAIFSRPMSDLYARTYNHGEIILSFLAIKILGQITVMVHISLDSTTLIHLMIQILDLS